MADDIDDATTDFGEDFSADMGGESEPGNAESSVFGTDDSASGRPLSSQQILTRGRELALGGVPTQMAMLLASLAELRARASGSSAAILPAIAGDLSRLREQYGAASQALSRRLGYAGGAQVTRGRGRIFQGAVQQYGQAFGGAQQQGLAGLLNLLGGIQPFLSGAARPPNVSTAPSSFNPALAGQSAQGIASLINQLQTGSTGGRVADTIAGWRANPAYNVGLPSSPTTTPSVYDLDAPFF